MFYCSSAHVYRGSFHVKSTSWILVKLIIFVVPMGLITHKKFSAPYASWFLIYTYKYFEYFMKICSSPFTKLTVTLCCMWSLNGSAYIPPITTPNKVLLTK